MKRIDAYSEALGRSIRGAMAATGVTQAIMADRIGISLVSLSRRINGAIPFTWPELVRIAGVLSVSVASLVEDAINRIPPDEAVAA